MNRRVGQTAPSLALLVCLACVSSPPPKTYAEIAPQLAVAAGSSQLLVYTMERAGAVIELDDRWIGYLATASSDRCSFVFSDASPGRHRVVLRMDNAPAGGVDLDNKSPRDEREIVLESGQRLDLGVASERDLLLPRLQFFQGGQVPDDCVYVGPRDAAERRAKP